MVSFYFFEFVFLLLIADNFRAEVIMVHSTELIEVEPLVVVVLLKVGKVHFSMENHLFKCNFDASFDILIQLFEYIIIHCNLQQIDFLFSLLLFEFL